MIAIAFALPQESRELVAALRNPVCTGSRALPVIAGRIGGQPVVILHTGIGAASARRQLQRFWQTPCASGLACAVGAGFAAGLDPSLPRGALVLAGNDPDLLATARPWLADRVRIGPLADTPEVLETAEAKAALARATGAVAADMETQTAAAFFRERGVPFLALRAVSDTANEALPVPMALWFDAHAQRPRPGALLGFLLRHPARIFPFIRFVAGIRRARGNLTRALLRLLPCFCTAAAPARRRQ